MSGLILGVVMIALCRRLTEHIPELRSNDAFRRKALAAKAARFAPLLLLFVFGAVLISQVYVGVLDHFTYRGWTPGSEPWDFAERNKGQEYRLLHFLQAFQGNPPQVSIDGYKGGGWNSNDRTPGLALLLPAVLGFGFLYSGIAGAVSIGQDTNYWKHNPQASKRLLNFSMGISARILLMLPLLWMWRDFILPTSGMLNQLDRTIYCRADVDLVASRLEGWFPRNGYAVPAYDKLALNTVPQEKKVGEVYVYRAWKPRPEDRWRFGIGGVKLLAPFLYVECIASDKPAETVVIVREAMVKPGTADDPRITADLDSLAAALADPQKPAAAKP